ncbi:HECT-domain (ubiquitin-transferase) containing protein [Babesia divergens]|uniref:HECT-type E3 ubiquitin transferase n=1 Tax=Babesia divergens TaxID=32595 RepID=A0AAD9GAM9_BABDI|nr:HECT-domain (ubiquitin-transferase) containing protein [Babesia divergens]
MKIGKPRGDNYKLVLGSLQPTQRDYVEVLVTCNISDLCVHLKSFTQWVWEKSDILCWAPALNRFDDIFRGYLDSYRGYIRDEHDELSAFNDELLDLVRHALRISVLIVENCTSKSIYNSLELLVSFLDDVHLDIVFLATKLLSVYFSRQRRNTTTKDVPEVSVRIAILSQTPLPEHTCRVHVTTDATSDEPKDKASSVEKNAAEFDNLSYSDVIDYYVQQRQYFLTLDSYIEIGQEVVRGGDTVRLRINVADILNVNGDLSASKGSSPSTKFEGNHKFAASAKSLTADLKTNSDLYAHMAKTLKLLIKKYKVEDCYFAELKYKVCKVYSLYFPFMQRRLVDIRICALICMLIMNSSTYNQFLTYNPSFLLEVTHMIKRHLELERSTMVIATELLAAMVYDGIHCKTLTSILGLNVAHGLFSKVLLYYLRHADEMKPLPPLLRFKDAGQTRTFHTMQDLWANSNAGSLEMTEKNICKVQLSGAVLSAEGYIKEWDWVSRLSTEEGRMRVQEHEDAMRILLQLLIVFYTTLSYHGCTNALTNTSVVEGIVRFLRNRDPIYLPVAIYVVQVVEALLEYNQSVSRTLRHDLQVFHAFVSRLQFDMYLVEQSMDFENPLSEAVSWPNGWKIPLSNDLTTLRSYWMSTSDASARRFLFKTVIRNIDAAAHSLAGRNESHDIDIFAAGSPVIPIIHSIFTKPQTYGLGVYSSTIHLISDVLGEDPVLQAELHRLDIIPALLRSISADNLKSEDCLHIVPTAICDILLHRSGQDYMMRHKYSPILKLVDIIIKKDFVLFDRFGEVASTIGVTLDTVARNNESSQPIIMKRVIKTMYDLFQEALTFPSFIPQDSAQCLREFEMSLHEFRTHSADITLDMLSSLDRIPDHEFYADRIAHLGKCLSTYLSYGQTLSHFIACDGLKLLFRLCSVPCLPPLSLLIYSQHPMAVVLKYVFTHSPVPCISYMHGLCKPYLLQPVCYRIPQTNEDVVNNMEYLKMLHGISYMLYLIHRDSSNFYQTSCSGKFQTSTNTVSKCDVHLALSAYLKRITTELPFLMTNFFRTTNEGDLESFFILSGKHQPHEHPQLKAYKMFNRDPKIQQNQSENSFSANDLFWSSQFGYAYSIPNPSYSGGSSSQVSDDLFRMNTEVCRLCLVTSKAFLYSLSNIVNKPSNLLRPANTCLSNFVAHHAVSLCLLCINMLNTVPSVDKFHTGSGILLDGMDCMNTARFVAEAMEMTYKLLLDDRTTSGLYVVSVVIFLRMSGIWYVTRVFEYMCFMHLGCALAMALRTNPKLSVEDVLGSNYTGHVDLLMAVVDHVCDFNLRKIRYTMDIFGRSIQICLGFFGKLCNPKASLNIQREIDTLEYTSSAAFCSTFSTANYTMSELVTNNVTLIGTICWEWLQRFASITSVAPSNSTASVHFYIPSKLIGSLLKVHFYVMDFLTPTRQEAITAHFSGIKPMRKEELPAQGLPSFECTLPVPHRNRRLRGWGPPIHNGDDNAATYARIRSMEEARLTLREMGFNDGRIERAIERFGHADISVLANWLLNRSNLDTLTGGDDENVVYIDTHGNPITYNQGDEVYDIVKHCPLFSFECTNEIKNDIWDLPTFARFDMSTYSDFRLLSEDMRAKFVDTLLALSTKVSASLNFIYEYMIRVFSLPINLIVNGNSDARVDDPHDNNILALLNFITNELENIFVILSGIKFSISKDDMLSVLSPIVFLDDPEKQAAFDSTILSGKSTIPVTYNCDMAKMHERLVAMFYLWAQLIGGRESYTSLLLKNVINPIDTILKFVDFFQKLRYDAHESGVLTFAGIGMKPSIPGIPISLPDWCMYMDFSRPQGRDSKSSQKTKVDYFMANYGFIRNFPVPQISCPPPFFKYALVCISELLKRHSLIGLSNIFESSIDLSQNVEILSATNNMLLIPRNSQKKMVQISLNIMECFPGADSDVFFALLSILDSLTESYSNVIELLNYKRLPQQENYPAHFTRRVEFDDMLGADALSILLTIPKSGTCKGILKMISKVVMHCMENSTTLKDAIERRVTSALSNSSEPVSLVTLVEKVYPFTKKDPAMLLQILQKSCVLTLVEGATNVELRNAFVTLRTSPRVRGLLDKNAELLQSGTITMSETIDGDSGHVLDTEVLLRNILRVIVVYMQIFCNLHGLTKITGYSGDGSKPGYPYALTIDSLFYILNTVCYNFPFPVINNKPVKLEIDLPHKPFPWKVNMVDMNDAHLVVAQVIRRIFLMICSLSVPQTRGQAKESQQDATNIQKLIVSTLDSYTNSILLISSRSMKMCVAMVEELKMVLLSLVGFNTKASGPHFLQIATYTVCNLLQNLLQLRFNTDSKVELGSDVVFQIKKCLVTLLRKLDLYKDGTSVLCSAITRALVLITPPNKFGIPAVDGSGDGRGKNQNYHIDDDQADEVDISPDVDSDSYDSDDDAIISSQDDVSEDDSEEFEGYLGDAMDEDVESDSDDEERDSSRSESDEVHAEPHYISDSDGSSGSADLETDNEYEEGGDDVEMVLPHQVDENYISINASGSESHSSVDDMDEEEDDDDAPRIRVVGELDEESRNETIADVMEGTFSHLNIVDNDENEVVDGFSSSSDGETFNDGAPISTAPPAASTVGSNSVSINIDDPNITLPGTGNNGIRIQIEISNNQGPVHYVESSSRQASIVHHAERQLQDVVIANSVAVTDRRESWACSGDLTIPAKHPMLPSTKKPTASPPTAGPNDEIINLIALSLPKVQIPKYAPGDIYTKFPEDMVPRPSGGNLADDRDNSSGSSSDNGTSTQEVDSPSAPLPSSYENRHLQRIASALGITYTDLFTLANMDPSVIAELPEDIREEIIVQQLGTINTDAVTALREAYANISVSGNILLPTHEDIRYIESLPRSLRVQVMQFLSENSPHGRQETTSSAPLSHVDTSFLAALGPALRSQIFQRTPQEFFANLAPSILGFRSTAPTRTQDVNNTSGDRDGNNGDGRPVSTGQPIIAGVAGTNDVGRSDNPTQGGVTFGLIIGEFRDGNNSRIRGSAVQRGRTSNTSRRFAPMLQRRRVDIGGGLRGMNVNDIILVDDNGVRMAQTALNPLENMATLSIPTSERLDAQASNTGSVSGGNSGNREAIDARILQSLPQLLNTFQPQFLNMLQTGSRAVNVPVQAADAPPQSSDSATAQVDTNTDVSCDTLVEDVVKVLPRSVCENYPRNVGDNTCQLLDSCRGAQNDFVDPDIVGICKMIYLKDEINKKVYFKLLYNLSASDGAVCHHIMKYFLYIIHTSIMALSNNSISTIRSDNFFSTLPRLYNSRHDDFPPNHLYGSLPYKHISLDARLDVDSKQQISFLSNAASTQGHSSCVDLNSYCSSYVACERVLEQLRSLLIALPTTIDFFSKTIKVSTIDESVSRHDNKTKRTKTTSHISPGSSRSEEFYPIGFILMATATKLFQSSPKLMNHLLMVIHHLVVRPPTFDIGDSVDTSGTVVKSDPAALAADGASSGEASPDYNVNFLGGTKDIENYNSNEKTSYKSEHECMLIMQREIVNNIDWESIRVFLDVHTSWNHQSNWLHSFNTNREGNSGSPMQIVAKIMASLHRRSNHADAMKTFFMERFTHLIKTLCESLSVANLDISIELEHKISSLLRMVILFNDMYIEAYKSDGAGDAPMIALKPAKLDEFYSNIDFNGLWMSLDISLTNVMNGTAAPNPVEVAKLSGGPMPSYKDVNIDNPVCIDKLNLLVPLIEVFMIITQIRVALDYLLEDISELDSAMSFVNFDYELPDGTLDFIGVAKHERFNPPKKEPWDCEEASVEISGNHLSLIYFTEKHSRALNCLIKQSPSLLTTSFVAIVRLAPNCLSFDVKRQYFRQKLKEGRQGLRLDTVRINVRRQHVFLDSYHQLRLRSGDEMKGKLSVSFGGEEGVDAGGLTREWFNILAKEMFNPNYGLFRREGSKQEFNHPNPLSGINPDHLNFFKFIGRVIGKAVYDGQHIDAYFCRSFYKHMLCRKIIPADAESVDPQFYQNLTSINNCRLEDLGLELFFSTEIDEFGKVKVIDLIPDGRNVHVTDDNKHKYIELLCRHKVTNGIKDQLDAFMSGFQELIPPELISIFDDKELELLISGIPTIDLADLRRNVDYVNYTVKSEQIVWLWEFLEGLDQNNLAAFLQFVTGTSRVPIGGFKHLMGMRGPQRISIHRTFGSERLPSAHTCFNQLDLPAYSSRDKLHQKMLQAIMEGKEGFGFI